MNHGEPYEVEEERDRWHGLYMETFAKLGDVQAERDRLRDAITQSLAEPDEAKAYIILRAALAGTEQTPSSGIYEPRGDWPR